MSMTHRYLSCPACGAVYARAKVQPHQACFCEEEQKIPLEPWHPADHDRDLGFRDIAPLLSALVDWIQELDSDCDAEGVVYESVKDALSLISMDPNEHSDLWMKETPE